MTKVVDVLDMEPERQGHRYVRYADDFSIYTKSKSKAKEVGNRIYVFLRERLKSPINKAKSGIRRPVNFELPGHGFVPICKKGIKGQYQLVVSKSSWNKFKRNLKGLTKKTKPMSLIERLDRITQVCRGWAVAQSPVPGTTITISRGKRKGYVPRIDYLNKEQTSIW